MAEKKRELTEEQKMVQRLSDMLKAANFNIQHQLDLGAKGRPDLVAEREEFARYRRYAINVVVLDDAKLLVGALDRLQSFAKPGRVRTSTNTGSSQIFRTLI